MEFYSFFLILYIFILIKCLKYELEKLAWHELVGSKQSVPEYLSSNEICKI